MFMHAAPRNRAPMGPPASYRMAKKGDRGEIYLYGLIGTSWFDEAISAARFRDDLKALGAVAEIDLRINSEGGDVFDATTMYTLLTQHKAKVTVHVDGLAASAASYVAMAGDEIRVAEPAFIMIHRAWTFAVGNAVELRDLADRLDQVDESISGIYQARTGNTADQVRAWMTEEKWFSGADAVKHGFANVLVENLKVAAAVRDPAKFKNLPAALRPRRVAALASLAEQRARLG